MKDLKIVPVLIGVLCLSGTVSGQVADGAIGYYNDALLFSQTSPIYGSTARMQGFAAAQMSLGADMSVTGTNPAGLGFFNRSVFSFTPSMNFHNSDADFLGGTTSTYKNNFNFANLGVVFNSNKGDYTDEKFKGGSFAISLNRISDFNNEITYQGRNDNSSIVDAFIANAGTTIPDNLGDYEYAAYENYLINPVYDDDGNLQGYDSWILGYPYQREVISTSGSQYQLNFAWGGNYADKVYFGAGVGFVTLNYDITRTYRESQYLYQDDGGNDVIDDWIDYTQVKDNLEIDGGGVNATVGLIVRPVDFITLGLSYATPTYYSLDEKSEFRNDTYWNNIEVDTGDGTITLSERNFVSDIAIGEYNLRTPGKLSAGASVFLGKYGFISGDVEFMDYTASQLKSNDFDPGADNETINDLYQNTINFRVGGEFRLDDFRFRTGYAYFGDPYADNDALDGSRRAITFGVGYRSKDYFVDLAVVNMRSYALYAPYFSDNNPIADIENKTTNVSATIGFNF